MKSEFSVKRVEKKDCTPILLQYHYLKDLSRGFKSGYNYGLYKRDTLVGVIIFTNLPVPELVKGMLGGKRTEQRGLFELSRLCLLPDIQSTEHNAASYFVSKAIRQFRKDADVKLILSYADSAFHKGTVYQASNFTYYGLTDPKKDFWIKQPDGSYKKHSRGKVKGLEGEWRPRSQKHRYVMCFDDSLEIKWEKQKLKKSESPAVLELAAA